MKSFRDFTENKDYHYYAIALPTKSGGYRRVKDTRFESEKSAHAYGTKYHTSKIYGKVYKVVPHPDKMDPDTHKLYNDNE